MINTVALMGRLTADPELRQTTSGVSVSSFTLAVDRGYVKQGEERQTDFIDVVVWRNTAEFATKYFRKGDMMAVVGSLQTRQYQDKEGHNRKAVEVQAQNISFCGGKQQQQINTENIFNKQTETESTTEPMDDEDLPF